MCVVVRVRVCSHALWQTSELPIHPSATSRHAHSGTAFFLTDGIIHHTVCFVLQETRGCFWRQCDYSKYRRSRWGKQPPLPSTLHVTICVTRSDMADNLQLYGDCSSAETWQHQLFVQRPLMIWNGRLRPVYPASIPPSVSSLDCDLKCSINCQNQI